MKTLIKTILCVLIVYSTQVISSSLTFDFSNPAFSGEGYSSHVLSIEQLQYNRRESVKDDITSAAAKEARDAKNTTLAKFVTNVESRIFANLSKQMVDNMFGTNCTEDTDTTAVECPLSGTATLPDGSTVYWAKDETAETITLTVTDASGTITQLVVPVGDFKFQDYEYGIFGDSSIILFGGQLLGAEHEGDRRRNAFRSRHTNKRIVT